ncbi:MAG: hypothetical protein GX220_00885 [Treponema sp.]|nr:hypothetical protein [Treponema sp.]
MDYKPHLIYNKILTTQYITVGDDVQYYIETDKKNKRIYLIFQETKSKRDWQNNFNFASKLYKKQTSIMRVHRGFGNAWKSCNDEIMKNYIAECNLVKKYQPTIIGWSYGGAITQLACEDFFYRTKQKCDVVTFGSPKIFGNNKSKMYVYSCCKSVTQYADNNDIITYCVPYMKDLNTFYLGEKFSLRKIFNPHFYHKRYGDENLYQ